MQFFDSLLTCSCLADETPRMVPKHKSQQSLLARSDSEDLHLGPDGRESRLSASNPYPASSQDKVISTSFRAAQYINIPNKKNMSVRPVVDFEGVSKQVNYRDTQSISGVKEPKVLNVVKLNDNQYTLLASSSHHGLQKAEQAADSNIHSVILNVNHPTPFMVITFWRCLYAV